MQHALCAETRFNKLLGELCQPLVVHDRRIPVLPRKFAARARRLRDAAHDALHLGVQERARLRTEAAGRAGERHGVGDDVVGVAGACLTDGDDRRIDRRHAPRDERLQREDDLRAGHDRVDARLRQGAVPALAKDRDVKAVGICGERSGAHAEVPAGERCGQVDAQHRVKTLCRARAHHLDRAAGRQLLRVLEQQPHRAAELRPPRAQKPRQRQRDGGVRVMPAGVHHAGSFRAVGQVVVLLNGQRVNVGAHAERRGASGLCAVDRGDQPRFARAAELVHAHLAQRVFQIFGRFKFMEGKLGALVQTAAAGDERVLLTQYIRLKHNDPPDVENSAFMIPASRPQCKRSARQKHAFDTLGKVWYNTRIN